VLISTIVWLGSLRKVFRLLIIIDSHLVVFCVSTVGFFWMIGILDNGEWPYLVIKFGSIVQSLSFNALFKVMVVYMKWSKARLIIYKILLLLNNGILVALCGYYFSINFSFTRHYLPVLDEQIQDFVMLYLVGIFGYQYEFYSKISDLDFTANLKYIYQMKDLSFH
jgi:hypothetical protein